MNTLPPEIMVYIFSFLSSKERYFCRGVSRYFLQIFQATLKVQGIEFINSRINSEGLAPLYGAKNITLYQCNCIRPRNRGIRWLGKNYVKFADLCGCRWVTDSTLEFLGSSVETILLEDCPLISDRGLAFLTQAKTILLRGCPKISNQGLYSLSHVRALFLGGNRKITNSGIRWLTNIEEIDLSDCPRISGTVFEYLSQTEKIIIMNSARVYDHHLSLLKRAKILNIMYCRNVTNRGIQDLPKGLLKLFVGGCYKVTPRIFSLFPNTEIIGLKRPTTECIDSDENFDDEDFDDEIFVEDETFLPHEIVKFQKQNEFFKPF